MKRFRWCGFHGAGSVWVFGLSLLVGQPALVQPVQAIEDVTLPPGPEIDATKGLIDGKVAVGLWPGTSSSLHRKPADPAGFEAHIALRDDLNSEIVHPAGTWFFPPSSGVFLGWIENPARSWISPSPTPLLLYNAPFAGATHGLALVDRVVRAGRVRLDSPTCGGHCTLGLLHGNSQISPEGFIRPEMKRLVPESTAVAQGALMPTGAVAAMLYDKELKEYRAVEALARRCRRPHRRPPSQAAGPRVL